MNQLHVGRGTTRGAMTVFPLWGNTTGLRRYTMGGRGLDVTEVEGNPDVGTLMIGNIDDRPALVLEGQLFEGGWQHRMARHSIMIGVHQRIPVQVACVEAGRWSGAARQHSRGRRATPFVRDAVRRNGDIQTEVWDRIAVHTHGAGQPSSVNPRSPSQPQARETAQEHNPTGSFVHRLDRADAERQAWSTQRALPGQVGVLIGVGGQPYVAEVFDAPHRLRAQLPTFLETAALDARLAPQVETPSRRARRFIERLDHIQLTNPEPAGVAERLHAVTGHADVAQLHWQGHAVHTRATHTRHPMLEAAR